MWHEALRDRRRRWTIVLGGLAAFWLLTLVILPLLFGERDSHGALIAKGDDGDEYRTGVLDPEAVDAARQFGGAPVLWLGEQFRDLKLADWQETPGGLLLVYGSCVAARGEREPSCVPPLTIQNFEPGRIPEVARVDPVEFRGIDRTAGEAGVTAAVLWLPGGSNTKVYVTTHVVGDVMEEALQALRTANHEVLGYAEVPAGGPLSAIE